jgi:hypothetical protein
MLKSWKDFLLRSGLPLENDVKRYLEQKGCVSSFESSYLRLDENRVEKEFSYDVDATYIQGVNFVEFMVECKYRHESTRWIFLPHEYNDFEEVLPNDFMHPFDHFVAEEFPFKGYLSDKLAPLCSKGIEIATNGANEKSISQAVHQLSYAFAEKVAGAIENQVFKSLVDDHIFFHVPVIVTTAELLRLREGVTLEEIKEASDIAEVAESLDCLVLNTPSGLHLQRHSREIISEARGRIGDPKLRERLATFTDDLNHLFNVIVRYRCPSSMAIVHWSAGRSGLEKLFSHIDKQIQRSKKVINIADRQTDKRDHV